MMNLTGKVAIVTGASSGIGDALAKCLGALGAAVAVNYSSNKEGAEHTSAEITRKGGRAVAIHADVSIAADVERLFHETTRVFGPPCVLVNNAGRYDFGPIDVVTEEAFHREFNLNVLAPILSVQEALKYFPETGGSVINISSNTSQNPVYNSALYSASKGALDTLTAALAKELRPRRIRVNAVVPGSTMTQGTRRIGLPGSGLEKTATAATPLGRGEQREDIARLVAFLASDESAWMTGELITASVGLGALLSEVPEWRLRRVKNLVFAET
jgi:3-oxoacyl-[acyl-carrier protein] reductase